MNSLIEPSLPTLSARFGVRDAWVDSTAPLPLPLFAGRVSAGFPSPADDYLEGRLDLNERLIANPPATFFVRVQGDSMIRAGIHPDDLLVVDRSLEPRNGLIVIAVVAGELTVKRLLRRNGKVILQAENPAYPPLEFTGEDEDLLIWGVVRAVVREL